MQSFSLLVPLWLLLTLFLYFFFRKVKKDVPTAGRWLLTTLLVLSAYEGLRLVLLFYGNHERIFDRDYRPANPLQGSITTTIGKQPDIFFLVYDGFTSSKVLREEFGYDNHPLDSFLEANSFRVVKNGRSNYFDTPVSLASTLNMGYLPQVTPTTGHEELILLSGLKNIHNNHLFRFLEKRGYRIINLSIFPYNNLASPLQQRYMGSRDRDILVMRTLENTSVWPLLNRIFTREKRINYDLTAQQLLEDLDLIDRATIPGQIIPGTQPRFFFIHTLLPHPPYVFERNGNVRNTIIYDRSNRQAYLEQLIYTSERIRQQVRQIREQNPQAIIILQGDHGFRHFPGPENKRLAFGMLHAVSIPQREYGVPHDSVSAVNTFRIILNTCFDQQLPLLPDTTIYPLQQITW
ncbi:MAG TPA: sulfatase-like hydrolase/transferase [Lacibacter sp.]|nr:sulfatase-like hydrolase/transferase [Lacibacter sp.]HMO89434.1 sulfatase-like hydrolase/transferase [Lacibacter sp.]HMP86098.1 sulfatase-like hydrolase/transferase [Lacibacter sp.]